MVERTWEVRDLRQHIHNDMTSVSLHLYNTNVYYFIDRIILIGDVYTNFMLSSYWDQTPASINSVQKFIEANFIKSNMAQDNAVLLLTV